MSRAAKIFFASSVVLSGVTVWGVHFIQKRESDVSGRQPLHERPYLSQHDTSEIIFSERDRPTARPLAEQLSQGWGLC
jgi:hypothetical protein